MMKCFSHILFVGCTENSDMKFIVFTPVIVFARLYLRIKYFFCPLNILDAGILKEIWLRLYITVMCESQYGAPIRAVNYVH